MSLKNIAREIPPKWQTDFTRFVETGEASQAFLDFLDEDNGCQTAVDRAFTEQAAGFKKLAKILGPLGSCKPPRVPRKASQQEQVSATIPQLAR